MWKSFVDFVWSTLSERLDVHGRYLLSSRRGGCHRKIRRRQSSYIQSLSINRQWETKRRTDEGVYVERKVNLVLRRARSCTRSSESRRRFWKRTPKWRLSETTTSVSRDCPSRQERESWRTATQRDKMNSMTSVVDPSSILCAFTSFQRPLHTICRISNGPLWEHIWVRSSEQHRITTRLQYHVASNGESATWRVVHMYRILQTPWWSSPLRFLVLRTFERSSDVVLADSATRPSKLEHSLLNYSSKTSSNIWDIECFCSSDTSRTCSLWNAIL